MQWSEMSGVFFTSMVKFMFAPALGPAVGLTFWETYIANIAGAFIAMCAFYFAAEYFLKLSHNRKIRKEQEIIAKGGTITPKKIFTKKNKTIIRIKNKFGIVPFAFWVPFFLSIPIGSMLTAKFFGKRKVTFPLMILGLFINNSITTGLVYLIKHASSSVL